MKASRNEERPAEVLQEAKQAGDARTRKWAWVERTVWTEHMLEALEKGVKGGVWFRLIDKVYRWPNRYFRAAGIFSLEDAHRALLQSS